MNDRDRLTQLLRGSTFGFTRDELAQRLGMNDRAMRDLIETTVAESDYPILPPTVTGGVYRIAQPHEHHLVNLANEQDTRRAKSLHRKAKGRRLAFERRYHAGSLFLDSVPELEAAT